MGMSRKIPAPFQRAGISLSVGEADKRTWQSVPARLLRPGDTVANKGLVKHVAVDSGVAVVVSKDETVHLYDADEIVYAFVKEIRD